MRLGSSPRVRGKRCRRFRTLSVVRLIPACAGKTTPSGKSRRAPPAHPRVCGENKVPRLQHLRMHGSSPRVRGKHRIGVQRGGEWRLIPACAGKTPPLAGRTRHEGAHPRVCGENQPPSWATQPSRGSSPRVRGKLLSPYRVDWRYRLIPACAGKTRVSAPATLRTAAHPRVCGENDDLTPVQQVDGGSSPRVRGKPQQQA